MIGLVSDCLISCYTPLLPQGVICLHYLFSTCHALSILTFLFLEHRATMCAQCTRLCTVEPQEGHSVGCRVNDAPWKCAVWQPSLYTELFPLARSWYLLVLLPGISIYTVGSFLLFTGQIFHKTPLSTKQNWLHNLESPMQNKNKLSFSLNVTFPEGSFLTPPR